MQRSSRRKRNLVAADVPLSSACFIRRFPAIISEIWNKERVPGAGGGLWALPAIWAVWDGFQKEVTQRRAFLKHYGDGPCARSCLPGLLGTGQLSEGQRETPPHTHTVCEPRVLLENLTWAGDESLSLGSCQSSGTEIVKVIVTADEDMGVQGSVNFCLDILTLSHTQPCTYAPTQTCPFTPLAHLISPKHFSFQARDRVALAGLEVHHSQVPLLWSKT